MILLLLLLLYYLYGLRSYMKIKKMRMSVTFIENRTGSIWNCSVIIPIVEAILNVDSTHSAK